MGNLIIGPDVRAWDRRLLWITVLSQTPWWHLRRQRKFREAHLKARADCERTTVWRKM